MPLSSAGETTVLNNFTTGRYISLHTANPGDSGASEVTGGAYARQAAAFTNTGNNPTVAANSGIVTYPTATASWGTITHFGIWTAVTAGSFLGSNTVVTPKTIDIDDIARWEIGKLTISTD